MDNDNQVWCIPTD
ncbi:unnamed protein product, partial [Rotaria sordida]